MRKNSREISISKERYEHLLNIESDYKILSDLLVGVSYFNKQTHNVSLNEEAILKVLEVVNEELYKKIINKFKEENE